MATKPKTKSKDTDESNQETVDNNLHPFYFPEHDTVIHAEDLPTAQGILEERIATEKKSKKKEDDKGDTK
jgi:hypothetical protein